MMTCTQRCSERRIQETPPRQRRFPPALLGLLILLLGGRAAAQPKILLVPIDDRPATTQFAEMIAAIAGRQLLMPPAAELGRFTTPGSPKAIVSWLGSFNASDAEALVVSSDMLAFGGLIASRRHGAGLPESINRLQAIREFRRNNPRVPVLAFSIVMRLAPTATATSAAYHDALARYASVVDENTKLKEVLGRTGGKNMILAYLTSLKDYILKITQEGRQLFLK